MIWNKERQSFANTNREKRKKEIRKKQNCRINLRLERKDRVEIELQNKLKTRKNRERIKD